MKSLAECIEFVQDEVNLAYNDGLPMTAASLESVLEYLLKLEEGSNDTDS